MRLAALVLRPLLGRRCRGAGARSGRRGERVGDGGVFVSKGVGRQIFAGGGGVAYGTSSSRAARSWSPTTRPTHDMKVESPVVPTTNADGSRTYVPAGGTRSVAFRISGTLYRVTVTGASTFNAAGVYGRLQLRGKGTLTINGQATAGAALRAGSRAAESRQAALPSGRGRRTAAHVAGAVPPPRTPPP